MIVRILGEGQLEVPDEHADVLNALDSALEQAVETGDDAAYRSSLDELLAKVRTIGTALPDDALVPSDAVLPGPDATVDDVKAMLADSAEGLIPG